MNFEKHLHHRQLIGILVYNFGCLIHKYYYHIVPKKVILIFFLNIKIIII